MCRGTGSRTVKIDWLFVEHKLSRMELTQLIEKYLILTVLQLLIPEFHGMLQQECTLEEVLRHKNIVGPVVCGQRVASVTPLLLRSKSPFENVIAAHRYSFIGCLAGNAFELSKYISLYEVVRVNKPDIISLRFVHAMIPGAAYALVCLLKYFDVLLSVRIPPQYGKAAIRRAIVYANDFIFTSVKILI